MDLIRFINNSVDQSEIAYEVSDRGSYVMLNNQILVPKIQQINEFQFSVENNTVNKFLSISNNDSLVEGKHRITFISFDEMNQVLTVRVNGKKTQVKITPKNEIYLRKIGLEVSSLNKISEIKSPMPGLILRLEVTVGQQLKTGDPILTLVAMKMENVIKSPVDAVIKEILVTPNQAVDKGSVLVKF